MGGLLFGSRLTLWKDCHCSRLTIWRVVCADMLSKEVGRNRIAIEVGLLWGRVADMLSKEVDRNRVTIVVGSLNTP